MALDNGHVFLSRGVHRSGEFYARAEINERGISVTVEGKGPTRERASEMLESRLIDLVTLADDGAALVNRSTELID